MITPILFLVVIAFVVNLFRERPGDAVRPVAVFLAALADTMDLLPLFGRECRRGLVDMASFLVRQCRHYAKTSREAAR